jgi:hypothetical protein
MATLLEECTTEEQRSVVRFLWTKGFNAKDIHKEMFPVFSGNCLSYKAVHNLVKKFSQVCLKHNTLTNATNKAFEYYIASLPKDDHTIWKAIKKFKRPQISIPPIRKSDRSWAKRDSKKATTFAEHLEQIFTPHSNINFYNMFL